MLKATKLCAYVLIMWNLVACVPGANILMTGAQFASHIQCQVEVAEELISMGHNVYLAIATRYPKLEVIEKKGIQLLPYYIPKEELYGISPEFDTLYNKMVMDNPGTTY